MPEKRIVLRNCGVINPDDISGYLEKEGFKGLEKALEKMNDPNGPFMWKDSYVFCCEDETGKILAHKAQNIIGFEAKDLRDVNGKPYFREFFHVANTKGEGFVTYMYPRIPGGAPEPKITYILKVPDTNIIVGAGFFE